MRIEATKCGEHSGPRSEATSNDVINTTLFAAATSNDVTYTSLFAAHSLAASILTYLSSLLTSLSLSLNSCTNPGDGSWTRKGGPSVPSLSFLDDYFESITPTGDEILVLMLGCAWSYACELRGTFALHITFACGARRWWRR